VADTVNPNDGVLSLREAIGMSSSGDAITFAPYVTGTITLTGSQLTVEQAVTIAGPGARKLAISGNWVSRVFHTFGTGNVVIRGLTLTRGRAPVEADETSDAYGKSEGGCIYNSGLLTLIDCAVTDSYARGGSGSAKSGGAAAGGGIYNIGNLTMRNCLVNNNSALTGSGTLPPRRLSYGGGIRSFSNTGTRPSLTLINTTVCNNAAQNNGGGIDAAYADSITLLACTVSHNVALSDLQSQATGGIFIHSSSKVIMRNTLVAQNWVESNASDLRGEIISQGHNLIGAGTDAGGPGGTFPWTPTDRIGTRVVPLDPLLDTQRNNGGPTNTVALLAGSPALDIGDDTIRAVPTSLSTDQRGMPRRMGVHVDIGAYERDVAQSGPNLVVNSTNDPGDGIAGTTECTLREALAVMNSQPDANLITFSLPLPATITLAPASGPLAITYPVSINGPSARLLAISGGGAVRVFDVISAGVILSGMTIRDGQARGPSGATGGTGAGGGIRNTGTLTIVGCTLAYNRANGGSASNAWDSPATGGEGYGGAIYNSGTLTLRNSTLALNNVWGGEAFLGFPDTSGSGRGGAIYNYGTATLTNCTLSDNAASAGIAGIGGVGEGGAVYNAGIANRLGRTSIATLLNCTVAGNRTHGLVGSSGGGLYTQARSTNPKLPYWNPIRLRNCIVGLNTAATAPDLCGGILSDGNNVVSKADGSTGLGTLDRFGSGAAPLSPRVSPLANNGGKTDTRALMAGSVAINTANASAAPTTDQRGAARSGAPDVGAFEFGVVVP
jgi:CSLREA domain-containing protein